MLMVLLNINSPTVITLAIKRIKFEEKLHLLLVFNITGNC